MFDPEQFATVAEDLACADATPQEGAYRSAVSRGYYSVLLLLKRRLVRRGFDVPEAGVHSAIRRAMKDTRIRHLLNIEDDLFKLCREREVADYDLGKDHKLNPTLKHLRACERLRESVQAIPDDDLARLGEELP